MGTLSGKTVIVTGASKGIGAAIAEAMIAVDAKVIAHYGSDRVVTPSRRQIFDSEAKCFAFSPPHRLCLGGDMLCD